MLQKLMVAIVAATFTLGAFAQGAPKSEPKAPTATEKKHAKGEKKAKSKAKSADTKAKAETKTK